MKTQSIQTGYYRLMLTLALTLGSLSGFSQTTANEENSRLTSLQAVVEGIKAKNESIKDADHVNVMVNDLLIKDLEDFKIDPKSIAMVEVLVLPKAGGERIKSIIINTKK